jgi:hypothetical protein
MKFQYILNIESLWQIQIYLNGTRNKLKKYIVYDLLK